MAIDKTFTRRVNIVSHKFSEDGNKLLFVALIGREVFRGEINLENLDENMKIDSFASASDVILSVFLSSRVSAKIL